MGPTRTPKTKKAGETSSSIAAHDPSKGKHNRKRFHARKEEPPTSAVPGVQKLKASLRQTRRLLAKDNLAADVRVETERRLKALEADLAHAESSKKERTLAVRYHKVKFFERQKIIRKLNQSKRKLSEAEGSSKKKVEEALFELRLDLNYILHYPKTKKYISLFPPEVRKGGDSTPSDAETAKTDAQRTEVRDWVREQMVKGVMAAEPEMHLDAGERTVQKGGGWAGDGETGGRKRMGEGDKERSAGKEKKSGVEADAFFGDDDEDEEGSAEAMDEDEEEGTDEEESS